MTLSVQERESDPDLEQRTVCGWVFWYLDYISCLVDRKYRLGAISKNTQFYWIIFCILITGNVWWKSIITDQRKPKGMWRIKTNENWIQWDTAIVRLTIHSSFVWWALISTPTSFPWEYLAINNTKVRLQAHLQVGRSFNSFKVLTKGALENFKFEFQLNTDCERTPLLIALITKPGCDYANNSNSSSANFLKSFTDDHYQNWLRPNLFRAVEHGRSKSCWPQDGPVQLSAFG